MVKLVKKGQLIMYNIIKKSCFYDLIFDTGVTNTSDVN